MSKTQRAVYLQIGGLAIFCGLFLATTRFFPIAEWLGELQQKIMRLGAWSAVCYPLLYACCNVLLLPGGILGIGGGFFFGLWWGFLIVLVGNVGGAAISFFIGRHLRRRWLQRKLLRNPTLSALQPAIEREGWKIILLSQLHPLFPTSLMNYLYGMTPIRFATCLFWIAVGQSPGLFLYAYLGTLGQLGLNLLRGRTHPRLPEYYVWGGGLLLSIVVLFYLSRISLRMLRQAEEMAAQVPVVKTVVPNLKSLVNI